MRVARSASGEGCSLFCSSLARMNQSIFSLVQRLANVGVFEFRVRLRRHWLEGPPFAAGLDIHSFLGGGGRQLALPKYVLARVWRSRRNPLLKRRDFLLRQFAGGGHAKFGLVVGEGLNSRLEAGNRLR